MRRQGKKYLPCIANIETQDGRVLNAQCSRAVARLINAWPSQGYILLRTKHPLAKSRRSSGDVAAYHKNYISSRLPNEEGLSNQGVMRIWLSMESRSYIFPGFPSVTGFIPLLLSPFFT